MDKEALDNMREIVQVLRNMDQNLEKIWSKWEQERAHELSVEAATFDYDNYDDDDIPESPVDTYVGDEFEA
jgi:hypothetical protein